MSGPKPQLLTIQEAAEELHSSVTPAALLRARREGRLWAKKIGKRYYTTRSAVMEFLECPDLESPRASTSDATSSNGSFETDPLNIGQDMALASVSRLKRHSQTSSQTERLRSAEVQPIRRS